MLQGVLAGCHGGGASGLACALRTQRFPCGIGVVVSRTGTFWRFQEPRVNYGLLCERPTQTIKPCVRSRKLDCFWRLNRFPGLASKWFVVLAVAATNSETVPKAARTCSPGEGLCMLRCRSACVALCDCSRRCGRFPWAVLTPALLETWGSVGTSMDRGGGAGGSICLPDVPVQPAGTLKKPSGSNVPGSRLPALPNGPAKCQTAASQGSSVSGPQPSLCVSVSTVH